MTVVELDLKRYSDSAKVLEECLSANAVIQLNEQIQGFVDAGLAVVGLTRKQSVRADTGDGAILVFKNPNVAHHFAEAVHEVCWTHNHDKTVVAAKRWFRIGIATGNLAVKQKAKIRQIAGSVISRATRLEAAANAGEIIGDMVTYTALAEHLKARYGDEEKIAGKHGEIFLAHRCVFVPAREVTPIEADSEGKQQEIKKNKIKISNLGGPSTLPPSPSLGQEIPNSLPPPPENFMGRKKQLAALKRKAEKGVIRIIGLSGMGGIGKSALAKKMAQDISGSFPDGNIYLNFLGLAKEQTSIYVQTQVIKALCRESFVKQKNLQADYRKILEKKRVLIFLDNMCDVNQLSKLEPPDGCLLILTTTQENSRSNPYTFDRIGPFDKEESNVYLSDVVAPRNITKQKIKQIAELCQHFPLALSIVGNLINSDPTQIRNVIDRMSKNLKEDEVIESSFSLSYDYLDREEKEYLRGISIFPDSFNTKAVTEILALGEDDSKRLLEKFVQMSLIDFDDSQQRYFFHGLVRLFLMEKMSPEEKKKFESCHSAYYKELLKQLNDDFLKGENHTENAWREYQENLVNINSGWQWAADNLETDFRARELCMEYPMAGYDILGVWQPVDVRIKWHEKGLNAAIKAKDRKSEGRHRGLLGVNYCLKGKPKESIEHLEEALKITKEANDRDWVGRHLVDLANAYLAEGCYDEAKRYFEEALVTFQVNGDKKGCAIAYNGLAKMFVNLGQPSLAKCPSERALYFSQEIKDPRVEGKALFNQGIIRRHLGHPGQALDIEMKALWKFEEIRDRRWTGFTLTAIGRSKIDLGHYDEAIKCLEQALNIFSEIGDETWEGKAKGNIGIAYREKGDIAKAIDFFKESIVLAQKTGDIRREAIHLNNLGRAYFKEGKFDIAETHYTQALTIAEKIKDLRRKCGVLGDLGALCFKWTEKNAAVEAKNKAKEALKIAIDIGDKRKEVSNHRILSYIYEKEGNIDMAILSIEKAIEVGGDIGIPYLKELLERGEGLTRLCKK